MWIENPAVKANGIMKANGQDNIEIILRIKVQLYPKFNKRFVLITAIFNKLSISPRGRIPCSEICLHFKCK